MQQRIDENRKLGEKLQQVHRVLANETTGKHFDNICHRRSSLCSSVDMPNALLQECLVTGFAASMLVYWSAALQENLKNEKVVQDGIMDGLWRDSIPSARSGGPQLPSGILAKFFLLGAIFLSSGHPWTIWGFCGCQYPFLQSNRPPEAGQGNLLQILKKGCFQK